MGRAKPEMPKSTTGFSLEETKKLAALARLSLTEAELKKLSKEIDSILEYVSQVKEATTASAKAVTSSLTNVMREDGEPHEAALYTEKLLSGAPKRKSDYLSVKKILNR